MLQKVLFYAILVLPCMIACSSRETASRKGKVLLKDLTLIDGTGRAPQPHMDVLIVGDTIAAVGQGLTEENATVISCSGKTAMPALISAHVHVGTLKGTTAGAANYTRENILRQLTRYQQYGVLQVLAMGTDRPLLFENNLYDSLLNGALPGARLHSAGYGFAAQGGTPPPVNGMDRVNRPANAMQALQQVDSLAALGVQTIKMWVDNYSGGPGMNAAVSRALILAAHRHGMKAAAHLFYKADAEQLVADSIDIIAHSIRDKEVDDTLLTRLQSQEIIYIPTLALDKFAYSYGETPAWTNDEFFRRSLEPGAYELLTDTAYRRRTRESAGYQRSKAAFEMALKNVYKIHKAGILVALGTDSGASAPRAQGFSEHLELELLVQAGFTPLEAITAGTLNAARALRVDDRYGTLAAGKVADLLILHADPAASITNTRRIAAVYKAGEEVSKGPLQEE
ncbi:amidohydrolase [Chitinophaga alhagiae]|uniref:Amidohydrolase n=1 Tax=Chitinophaga alhagiae TaxID=2203219 RepID=A0ABM6W9R4_9BACT|nr:amidohydrolase family protein [Chitinophaga alhagiae]AWO00638.1 amidohydrolase [Chitinophaga alhagiae]